MALSRSAGPHSPEYLEGLARLVQRLPGVQWTVDAGLRITSTSGAALAALGMEPGQLVGLALADCFTSLEEARTVIADHRRALAGETVTFDLPYGGRSYSAWLEPLRDAEGRVVAVLGFALDVSALLQAEEALHRSEAHYRALVQEAPVGIFRSSAEGRFVTVNPALVRLLGYDHESELLGLDLAADVYAEPGIRQQLVDHYERTDRVAGVDVEWRRKDGSHITVRLSGQPVRNIDGDVTAWEMVAEDVTERRRLEAQLRTAQKMEALGLVTGGVAHDFNNLLTTILANAELISAALPPAFAQIRGDLLEIHDAAQRGGELVKKLLGFSRRERLVMQPTDLADLVHEMLGVLRRLLPERIVIEADVASSLPAVLADPGAMQQILLSLATNARDAIAERGAIRIEVRASRLDPAFVRLHGWGTPGDYVSVIMTDSGLGMDEATRQRVFEPFFTTKPPGAGSGLGLAMVYGLMKQQNGFVDVVSATGRGTAVTLYLPVTQRQPGAVPAAHPERGGGATVIVAEDEEPIRRVAQRVLERHGFRVLTAADGLEALRVFQEHEGDIALVLTDVVMPRMGGQALLETLRGAGKHVPVVFMSGFSQREAGEHAADPTVPFLPKPWTVEQLVDAVRRAAGMDA